MRVDQKLLFTVPKSFARGIFKKYADCSKCALQIICSVPLSLYNAANKTICGLLSFLFSYQNGRPEGATTSCQICVCVCLAWVIPN